MGALSIGAILIAAPLSSAWAADDGKDHAEAWAQHRHDWVRSKLDKNANRLEIKASQQVAWEAYADARKALAEKTLIKLPENADAAAFTRHRAERVTEFAQKLTTLADATAKLQDMLSPEQRKTLDQIVRHAHDGHCHHGFFFWHGHEQGPNIGQHGNSPAAKATKPQTEAQSSKK
jgi:hypothetical protein